MNKCYNKDHIPTDIKELKKVREEKKAQKRKWKEEKLLKKMEKERLAEIQTKKAKLEETEAMSAVGRKTTVSIAIPGSIMDNAQSPELRTYLAGQIARAAVVFNVDEIIIFNETTTESKSAEEKHGNCNVQLARILQYLECPQYLRKAFFPKHKDLQYAGLLNPLASPHHMQSDEYTPYREGVVLDVPVKQGRGSCVNVGLHKLCQVDKHLQPGSRVTVKMKPEKEQSKKKVKGVVVAPSTPTTDLGLYWGYTIRLASSLSTVFTQCPHPQGYDTTIGTSERGDSVHHFTMPHYKHLLVVFGGVHGLEVSLDSDENLHAESPRQLFDHYLNTCPDQGSNTIRTEEAILITMSALRMTALKKA